MIKSKTYSGESILYRDYSWCATDECSFARYDIRIRDDEGVFYEDIELGCALDHSHHRKYNLSEDLTHTVNDMIERGEILLAIELAEKEGTLVSQTDYEYGVKVYEFPEDDDDKLAAEDSEE